MIRGKLSNCVEKAERREKEGEKPYEERKENANREDFLEKKEEDHSLNASFSENDGKRTDVVIIGHQHC